MRPFSWSFSPSQNPPASSNTLLESSHSAFLVEGHPGKEAIWSNSIFLVSEAGLCAPERPFRRGLPLWANPRLPPSKKAWLKPGRNCRRPTKIMSKHLKLKLTGESMKTSIGLYTPQFHALGAITVFSSWILKMRIISGDFNSLCYDSESDCWLNRR